MSYHFYDKPFREMDKKEQKNVQREVQARMASGNLWDDEMKYVFRNRVFLANALKLLSILTLTEEEIESMTIQEEYIPKKAWNGWRNERKSIFDVYAIIRGGERKIDLEIQRIVESYEIMRVIYYFSKMVSDREKGTDSNTDSSHIAVWLFKSDISKLIPELKDMEPSPFYCFSFCTMKWGNADILTPKSGMPISPDKFLIFVNGGFDWDALRKKRPLTKAEEDMETFILDMRESDTENIRNRTTRDIMEEYRREELDSDIIMTLSENLSEESLEFMRQKEKEALSQGREEGSASAKNEIALNLLKSGQSVDFVAINCGLEKNEVEELLTSMII